MMFKENGAKFVDRVKSTVKQITKQNISEKPTDNAIIALLRSAIKVIQNALVVSAYWLKWYQIGENLSAVGEERNYQEENWKSIWKFGSNFTFGNHSQYKDQNLSLQ